MFINFEGINGAGKTTIINEYSKYLNSINIKNVIIKFPNRSSNKTGKIINDFLNKHITKNNMIDIFYDNIIEEQELINKYINEEVYILCDRYIYSTIVYAYHDEIIKLLNNKKNNIFSLDFLIEKYYKNVIIPDYTFLINGNFLKLRNEKEEKYHNNKNDIVLCNFIHILSLTNTNWYFINNENNNISNIIKKIHNITNKLC